MENRMLQIIAEAEKILGIIATKTTYMKFIP